MTLADKAQAERILDFLSRIILPRLHAIEDKQLATTAEVHAMRADLARGSDKFQEHEGRISIAEGLPTNGFHGELVLLVDDERGVVDPIAMFLRSCGARVVVADSIRAAHAAIQAELPAAAIVDVALRGGDNGLELAEELRALGVAVIVMSGWPDRITGWPEERRLNKPSGFDVIHERILAVMPRTARTDPAPAPEPTWSGPLDGPPTVPDAGRRGSSAPDTPEPNTTDETPDAKRG